MNRRISDKKRASFPRPAAVRPACLRTLLLLTAVLLTVTLFSACKPQKEDQKPEPFLPGLSGPIELPDDDFTDSTPLPEPTEEPTAVPEEYFESHTYSFVDDAAMFKICGRSDTTDKGTSCDWSAGGFEINAYCRGDVTVKFGLSGVNFLAVFIDGERQKEDVYVRSSGTVIAKDLPAGRHHIEVYRQSEVREGRLQLKTLTLNGNAPGKQRPLSGIHRRQHHLRLRHTRKERRRCFEPRGRHHGVSVFDGA